MAATSSRSRGAFARRWYIWVAGLVVTIFLCVAAFTLVPATFSATTTVVLTPPAATGQNAGSNPYTSLGGYTALADVVSQSLMGDNFVLALRDKGVTGTYTVQRDLNTNGPILVITMTGSDSAKVLADLETVVAQIPPTLIQLQDATGAAESSFVTSQTIATPTKATTVRKTQQRALLVAAALGILGTAAAVSLIDARLLRRRDRRVKVTPRDGSSEVAMTTGSADVGQRQSTALIEQIPVNGFAAVNGFSAQQVSARPAGPHAVADAASAESPHDGVHTEYGTGLNGVGHNAHLPGAPSVNGTSGPGRRGSRSATVAGRRRNQRP